MAQTSIFDYLYETYKISKPIRLIEMFAGYGSQHLALNYLGCNVESYKIIEWAVPSIQAYKDLHYTNKNDDYTENITLEELVIKLVQYGISSNYNEPMSMEQIKRKGLVWCKQVYNNIKNTNNLVNIMFVKGKDLEIKETNKYDYILTYSFPCQDLSLAGKRMGMDADSQTRSSMLWQVHRILDELNELGTLPNVLLMENVPQVMAQDNLQNMEKWDMFLSRLGYKSYIKNMIATNYGIPQIRNRTFMSSILGEYNYTFPNPIPLKLKLKDMLEKNVDERYYLSGDILKHIKDTSKETVNFTQYDRYNGEFESLCRIWKELSPTIHTKSNEIKIYDNNKIRNMTPLEAFRLMGVKDEDYYKIATNQSNSSLYHLAGDSIVVNVLMAIFKQLL